MERINFFQKDAEHTGKNYQFDYGVCKVTDSEDIRDVMPEIFKMIDLMNVPVFIQGGGISLHVGPVEVPKDKVQRLAFVDATIREFENLQEMQAELTSHTPESVSQAFFQHAHKEIMALPAPRRAEIDIVTNGASVALVPAG